MISVDTNIFLYALNPDSPRHEKARSWLESLYQEDDVILSEFILLELYSLLRNPAVLARPLTAPRAHGIIQTYRSHPRWRLVGFTPDSRALHNRLWDQANKPQIAFRRLFDIRTALTLLEHGVTEFATTNQKDFKNLGFNRVFDPAS